MKKALVLTPAVVALLAFSAAGAGGTVVFSTKPIDPAAPTGLATSFKAGETIHALMQFPKPIAEIYKGKDQLMLYLEVDGEPVFYQYLTFKDKERMKASTLRVEIAPDASTMSSYKDPGLSWGTGKKNLKLGPEGFTWALAQLSPGKHTVTVRDNDFGSSTAKGSFTIDGSDYSAYAKLHEAVKGGLATTATLPAAGMKNASLEAEMRKLLENAGWKGIRRLVIVDKDWWIDRVSGGDSPVESRRMDGVAAACDASGCFYKRCTFTQRAVLGGGFGKLELTHQGDRKPIPEANIGK